MADDVQQLIVRRPDGRFGKGTRSPAPITHDNAREMLERRREKKRQIIAAAAQAAVQRGDLVAAHGGDAWLAEVAQSMMTIATTPEASRAVAAAEWLMLHTGNSETKQDNSGDNGAPAAVTLSLSADAVRMLAGLIGGDNSNYRNHSGGPVVDADAVTVQGGEGGK